MRARFLCFLSLAGLLLSPVTAQAGPSDSAAAIVTGVPGTVRLAVLEPDSIDPAKTSYTNDYFIANQLFSGLTRIHPATKEPIPDLASGWTVSSNKMEYTFTLRAGLKWSNGTALTATAVRYGILRSLNPATGASMAYVLFPILNAYEYNNGTATADQVGVAVLSPTQVKFTLTDPASYFPAVLALPVARPQPSAVINLWGDTWTEPGHILTSGAYRLTQWVHDDKMLLDKWAGFYAAAGVKIPHISVKLTDETTAFNMFVAGTVDTVAVPISNVPSVRANPALSPLLHEAAWGCIQYYGFNTALEPFDDPRVRKAFIAAVNRQGLIDSVQGGTARVAQTFTPPGIFGFVDGVVEGVGIPYGVAQAQQWLAEAGYPNGAGLPPITLWFNASSSHQANAEYIQANWAANLNATVNLQALLWGDYLAQLDLGTMQIWRLSWCLDYNDAYNFLGVPILPNPGRYGGWSNATYQSQLTQALNSNDNATRAGYYQQGEEILVGTDAVVLPLYYNSAFAVTRPYLHRPYPLVGEEHIRDWKLTHATKTVVSTATQDGWVLESTETSGVGGEMNSTLETFSVGDYYDRQIRGFLSFNTSILPDNAVITSAIFRIKKHSLEGVDPFGDHGNLVVDVRKGAFSNSAALQLTDFQAPANKMAAIIMLNHPTAGGWYSRAMPPAGFRYINKTGLSQFRLRFAIDDNNDDNSDYLRFFSGNAAIASNRPVLIIKYYVP